jgi:soluble cytochrome b562
VEAERQRNLATQKDVIQSQGLQSAFQNAQQAQQYGANLGLQGLQAGAGMYGQGIGAQQAAYGMGLQGAGQLGALGGQQLAAQQSILGAQNQAGAQQQAREQQIINQAMTDYANAQQYPLMQLGTMSNMIRGLPMQSQSTSQYAAAPNAITQGIGAVGALSSLAAANPGKAEGGIIEGYASGGITSYDVGGQVESQLEDMDIDSLKRQVKESSSPSIKRMAQRILAEKQTPRMAGGGIIAFAEGDQVKERESEMMRAIKTPFRALYGNKPSAVSNADYTASGDLGGAIMAESVPSVAKPSIPKQEAEQAAAKAIVEAPAVQERPAPTPAPAPAAGPRQTGIIGASKPDEFMDPLTKERDRYVKEAAQDRSVLAKKLEEEAGTNVGRESYRAEEMARRANLKDEAERQKQMRLAEFFASWGSTPGPVLVAGMNALKKSIPGMVEDSKEAKKLQRESDKIIYDIDEATRLEKAGYRDKADAKIQQAATNAAQLNNTLGSYAGHKLSANASMANAAAQREATSANKAIAAEENKIKTLLQAQANTTNLLRVHETERKDPEYANAANMAKIGKDENGIDKPLDKIPKELRGQISEARKIVNQYATRHRQELQAAREQENALTERTSLGAGKNKATNKNDPLGIL